MSGARADEGRGTPLIGTFKGKILIDQVDLEKAQNEDRALRMVKSWFNIKTGKIKENKIDTLIFNTVHEDVLQLYKVRKQLRLTDASTTNSTRLLYLLENELDSNPRMRIVPQVPRSARCTCPRTLGSTTYYTTGKRTFFWPRWRADTAVFMTECPGCLHREEVNLKQVDPYDG